MKTPRKKKPTRGGSKPRIADVAATARVELLVPPEVKKRWQDAAAAADLSIAEMIRGAMDIHLHDAEAGELADLGRQVLELAAGFRPGYRFDPKAG